MVHVHVTYHPQLPCLGKIIRNHLFTFHISEAMKKAVPKPSLVANRRLKNLKDLSVKVMMTPPQQLYEGNSLCGRPCCKSCMHIGTGIIFESATTEKSSKLALPLTAGPKTLCTRLSAANVKKNKQDIVETEHPWHF